MVTTKGKTGLALSPHTTSAAGTPAIAVAALLAAMTSIQYGSTLAKDLFPIFGTEGTTALRLAIGGIMLTAVLRPWRVRPSKSVLPFLIAYGVSLAAMNLLFYGSLNRIPLGVAVTLAFSGPLLVATLASRRKTDFAWVTLAVAGIVLLSPLVHTQEAPDPIGIVLALGAGGCWALYIVFGQKAGNELGTQTVALGMLIAAVLVLPLGVAQAKSALLDPSMLLAALVVGLFSSALPFWLEMVALIRMPAKLYGTLTCMEPALGALAGLVFLHEILTSLQIMGVAAVVVAAFGAALTNKPPVPSPE